MCVRLSDTESWLAMTSPIDGPSVKLARVIRRHATSLAGAGLDVEEVNRANEDLADALAEYALAVRDFSNMEVPFSVEEVRPNPVKMKRKLARSRAGSGEVDASKPAERVTIEAKYVLTGRRGELDALRRLVDARSRATGRGGCDDYEDNLLDLMTTLFEADGWNPREYGDTSGFEVDQSSFTVGW